MRTYHRWPHVRVRLTSNLSSPTCSLNCLLWQLTWILWEIRSAPRRGYPSICSRRLRSHFKSSTSAPLEREKRSLSAARRLPSKGNHVSLLLRSALRREDTLACVRVFLWADACHCVPGTNASWHVGYLKSPLLLTVRREEDRLKSARVSHNMVKYAESLVPDSVGTTEIGIELFHYTHCIILTF